MSKRERIAMELDHMPEQALDKLPAFLQSLKEAHAETAAPLLAAESPLAKDRLTPEEDATWALAGVEHFELNPKRWQAFTAALDRPARKAPRLRRLLQEPSILDRQ
jgi:hypothetical protein